MPKKTYKISEVGGFASVARLIGVNPTALKQAINRGVVEAVTLGDSETRVVVIESAKNYWNSNPKAGRPAKT